MATAREESAPGRSSEGLSSRQGCDSSEALTEWRSSEQVETGTPSTSPPYWDTDDSDDDGGLKPCDLYGKYTWKIEKFSTINKRELKSSVFEVGGYRWYILIYPQGCDVCNHLSLFLCVANHDKLLPGWSHFAQFTIAVVNKDPKKSKYSDTLHRFWKKEHDWGWKKFMELSKVSDGFLDADTLIIKAQVQVIRERTNRPFRCLDCQYRRELVRVYLTNVEQICRRFVDDRRGKLENLLEDKARWSSFCSFWLEIDESTRHVMSSEKMGSILKMIVKQFFIEKDVTSTLVIDSLYSGLKALKGQSKRIIGKDKVVEGVDIPPRPVIQVEEDMFVLVDDVLLLLERATMEPLPPKDDKGPQNRTKDGAAGEDFTKDSIERDERRLTELGRRTVEIFVLTHIFSKIEAAYQEAIALKRQEELIREEKAESELRAKREIAGKEKRLKKKQSKQKRNNRKAKDKLKDEKPGLISEDKHILEIRAKVMDSLGLEDVSDVSDSVEYCADTVQPDSEDRDSSPVNWDTDISELKEISGDMRSSSVMDDTSSTTSTDSAPSVKNLSYRGNSNVKNKIKNSPIRGKQQRATATFREAGGSKVANGLTSEPVKDLLDQRYEAAESSLKSEIKQPEPSTAKKEAEVIVIQRPQSNVNQGDSERQKKRHSAVSNPQNSPKKVISKSEPKDIVAHTSPPRKISSNKPASTVNIPKPTEKSSVQKPTFSISRPLSTPPIPGPKPAVTATTSTSPALSRSMSATGRLVPDPSPAKRSYSPPSYKNAILGTSSQPPPLPSSKSSSTLIPGPIYIPQLKSVNPTISYTTTAAREPLHQWPFELNPHHASQSTSTADEFPHLDIINDLLDDEQGFGTLPSNNASCRSQHMYYQDFIQPEYAIPANTNTYDALPEYISYNNVAYMNGHIDGNVQNQWPIAGYDQLSMMNSGAGDWYTYGVPEYSDLACGLNGYSMFRPSNGQ